MSKKIYVTLLLIILIFSFRGFLYRTFVKYQPLKERKGYSVKNSDLIDYIEKSTSSNDLLVIISIVNKSNELTNERLKFSSSKCYTDPNKLIHSRKANCVGYAHFFSATFNYLIEKSKLSNQWKAKTHLGKLYFLGVDIHQFFDSPFFKDHDFVIIKNSDTGEKIYIDPTVSDYLGIDSFSNYSN